MSIKGGMGSVHGIFQARVLEWGAKWVNGKKQFLTACNYNHFVKNYSMHCPGGQGDSGKHIVPTSMVRVRNKSNILKNLKKRK